MPGMMRDAPPPQRPASKRDQYKWISIIGRGSFGEAWLVREIGTNEQRVIKQIRLEDMPEKEAHEAGQEVTTMRELVNHPNIVKLHDSFREKVRAALAASTCSCSSWEDPELGTNLD